jgi:hypothetical protein
MRRLAAEDFSRARRVLLEAARPVDRARFLHHFEGGPADDVSRALAPYQNPDGGFGHGLEPDFRLPATSALATTVGLRMLGEAGLSDADPRVRGAVGYLANSFDRTRPGWRDVPAAVNDHPHAPWWERGDPGRLGPEDAWGNPDAEAVAAFHRWPACVPEALREETTALALARLEALPGPPPPYVALCYQQLAAAAPAEVADRVADRLRAEATAIAGRAAQQSEFATFWLAPTPEAPLAEPLRTAVAMSLDEEIARQSPEGHWAPRWSWGDAYPEAWAVARREWCGEQTLHTLLALRAWDRIDLP